MTEIMELWCRRSASTAVSIRYTSGRRVNVASPGRVMTSFEQPNIFPGMIAFKAASIILLINLYSVE